MKLEGFRGMPPPGIRHYGTTGDVRTKVITLRDEIGVRRTAIGRELNPTKVPLNEEAVWDRISEKSCSGVCLPGPIPEAATAHCTAGQAYPSEILSYTACTASVGSFFLSLPSSSQSCRAR